jgi:signal transduction histidine kinase
VPVELDALVVDAVRRHLVRAGEVRLRISRIEPLRVDGDPDRLQELLGILLENAQRYTPSGGEVVVSATRAGPMANLEIRDTGIGIGDEDPDRLFERLYRGTRAKEMQPSGTGLGLPIARWIVERHGGRIHLRRAEPTGTVASVLLPLAAPTDEPTTTDE